ncbi:MAG TPA: cytochrome c maturation protein CcmE [Longimicrobiales bacterium]|jgi:cytochrome c-type biogenesis protein CcmE|nr:cytochrome c maturation protein CcmE [Longimicrobiales bacterium]HSK21103.1 cytochrome c maturation protein CcmE [Longimicrobiales bacterium]
MMGGKKKVGFALALIIVLSSFGYLVYGGIGENIVYFVTPGELLAKGTQAYDKPIRLGGQVMPGTMQWDADALDLRFTLQDEDGQIRVHSQKAPPAMFREGMGVIVEGKLNREGIFESSSVMVKHSNEYRPPEDGTHPKPEDMYKSLIRES